MFLVREIFRSFRRRKVQSLLLLGTGILLFSFLGIYWGNIRGNQKTIKALSHTMPVYVQIINRDGSQEIGLEITSGQMDALLQAGVKNPVYTAQAGGNIDPAGDQEPVKVCDTIITAANTMEALSVGEKDISFLESYGPDFLQTDQPWCLINEKYGAQHKISPGDEIELTLYGIKYDSQGLSSKFQKIGKARLLVIGTLQNEERDMVLPADWMRGFAEEQGKDFYYDSARAQLKDPMKLNEFKEKMENSMFLEQNSSAGGSRRGDTLLVQDTLFISTAEQISQNLKLLEALFLPFCLLLALLLVTASFLILRSRRMELAIKAILGRSKAAVMGALFLENWGIQGMGCVLAVPVLYLLTDLEDGKQLLELWLLFLGGSGAANLLALGLLCRFDIMGLLTKID